MLHQGFGGRWGGGVSGVEIRPHSQKNSGDYQSGEKKSQSQLKIIFNSSIQCENQTLLFEHVERLFDFDFMLLFNDSK